MYRIGNEPLTNYSITLPPFFNSCAMKITKRINFVKVRVHVEIPLAHKRGSVRSSPDQECAQHHAHGVNVVRSLAA